MEFVEGTRLLRTAVAAWWRVGLLALHTVAAVVISFVAGDDVGAPFAIVAAAVATLGMVVVARSGDLLHEIGPPAPALPRTRLPRGELWVEALEILAGSGIASALAAYQAGAVQYLAGLFAGVTVAVAAQAVRLVRWERARGVVLLETHVRLLPRNVLRQLRGQDEQDHQRFSAPA